MSFGRWLLVHSFSIFLLFLFFFSYVYRSELQLATAYQQLLNLDSKAVIKAPAEIKSQQSAAEPQEKPNELVKPVVETTAAKQIDKESYQKTPSTMDPLPTVSTIPAKPLKQVEPARQSPSDDRLFQARQAYWDKKYAESIYIYRQLIQENSFNPDYLGELGNIYYSLNDNENASRLYYQAALQFIELKEIDRARSLVAPVIAMNRELGEQLKLKLQ